MNNKFSLAAVALVINLLNAGCKHRPDYHGELITETNCDPQTVYFQNTILPLLNSRCAMNGCHNSITHADGINLTTYTTIMNSGEGELIIPYDAHGSEIYEVIADGSMPPNPYSNLTAAEIQALVNWINQGALNNVCLDCDTTQFKFGADIWPIINSKCTGCHGAVNPDGMTTILNYSDVNALALNGKLVGVVTGVGYGIMPPAVGLPDCEKTKILKWINNGALDD
jgi:uncharacterized membrane protein